MAAEAAGHERDTSVAKDRLGGVTGRLELKNRPGGFGGGSFGGGGRGGGGGQRQHMLLDDHDNDGDGTGAAAQRRAPPQVRLGFGHGCWARVRFTCFIVGPWGTRAAICCTVGDGDSGGGR